MSFVDGSGPIGPSDDEIGIVNEVGTETIVAEGLSDATLTHLRAICEARRHRPSLNPEVQIDTCSR